MQYLNDWAKQFVVGECKQGVICKPDELMQRRDGINVSGWDHKLYTYEITIISLVKIIFSMSKNHFSRIFSCLLLIVALSALSGHSIGQETSAPEVPAIDETTRLNKLVDALDKKQLGREALQKAIVAAGGTPSEDVQQDLKDINTDIQALRDTFELLTVGDMDDTLFNVAESKPFDWKVELMLVLEPVLDSLQSLTEKPRQLTNLRAMIALNKRRLDAAEKAIGDLALLPVASYEEDTVLQIRHLQDKWLAQKESVEQRLLAAESQLHRLESADSSGQSGIVSSLKTFILGRGLTLVLAVVAAVATWLAIRFVWWFFSNYFVTKEQRRGSLWYRLLSYSFYIITIIFCIIAVLAVLYVREDLLLLALGLLALAVTGLGIRRYIPAYVKEARLLLDLGAVREGERVMYSDLPWQVMSINLQTVLWNPTLEGIVRLPLEKIETLTSRPVKDQNWFPTRKGDYVLLPDSTFALVLSQTPELVELRVRGGMVQWVRTADWYAMSITNLSIGKTFGVSVTFGFDYSLQSISLTDIPRCLHGSVTQALTDGGYKISVDSVLVELKSASASSIDYLVFVTIDSQRASDYFALERLIQQTCVAVANEQGWNIPFPQMMIHHQAV
jgi:small-conductance mechanosensitive channel